MSDSLRSGESERTARKRRRQARKEALQRAVTIARESEFIVETKRDEISEQVISTPETPSGLSLLERLTRRRSPSPPTSDDIIDTLSYTGLASTNSLERFEPSSIVYDPAPDSTEFCNICMEAPGTLQCSSPSGKPRKCSGRFCRECLDEMQRQRFGSEVRYTHRFNFDRDKQLKGEMKCPVCNRNFRKNNKK